MRTKQSKKSKGFTLVETLVMAATCVLLLTITLPGMLHARQRAQQESCKNNLRQLGIAMHNYHDTFLSFPPAWCTNHFDANSRAGFGWQSFLLPYVEQAPLYTRLDFSNSDWVDQQSDGEQFTKLRLPSYLCPQDSTGGTNPFRDGFGTSNYSGNFGTERLPRWYETSSEQYWPGGAETPRKSNGIFVVNGKIGIRDIIDGTSNTVMISERSAYSGAGLWIGVRSNRHENDVMTDMNYISGVNKSFAGFSGRHEKALNMLLCDGSVRLVKDDIDSKPEGGLLQSLSTRAGGEVIVEF